MNYSVYVQPPVDFKASVEAAGCFFSCDNKILFLKRHPSRSQGNTWGVPAGKLEAGESAKEAVIREIREEVGLDISQEVQEVGKIYIKLASVSYVYHMFYKFYEKYPELQLATEENVEARWVTLDEALELPLISAGREALQQYQRFLDGKRKS